MSIADRKAKLAEVEESEVEQSFDYSVKMMRRLLQLMGMWPVTTSTYPKALRVLLLGAAWFVLIFLVVPVALFMIIIVKDFQGRLRLLGPLSFGLMNVCKMSSALLREAQLRECVEWMASDWRSARSRVENELMLKNAKYASIFTTFCVTCQYMGGLSYGILFSFMMDPIVVGNRTTRMFAYPSYFVFFDPHAHFFKVYAFHVTCCFVQCSITGAVASVAIAWVMHVCGQIAAISWMLRNITSGSFDAAAFRRVVEKHLRAIMFAKKLEDYLNGICMIELTGGCFNICMLGYYFITERGQSFVVSYTYCMLLTSFVFNIFIFCYIGDRLTGKCEIIGNVAYNVDWYDLSAKDARNLLLIVALSQRPIVLTAGKMATLSMSCFSSVLKAAFSYLNMLRTVTN